MFYIYLMKYLFNISEYKAMLIKLLIYDINIYIFHSYMCMYVCMYEWITKSTDKNTVKVPDR